MRTKVFKGPTFNRKNWKGLPIHLAVATERDFKPPRASDIRKDAIAARVAALPPEQPVMGYEWWQGLAFNEGSGSCKRCSGLTVNEYIAPHDKYGEGGIFESCRLCGWSKLKLASSHGRPVYA